MFPLGFPRLAALSCLTILPLGAQWTFRASKIPRSKDGKPNLTAPAPRTASGVVDLSGIWQTDPKFNTNLAADLKAADVPMLPWAQKLYEERQNNESKDDPEGLCMPPGVPRASGVPFPEKIIQTPSVVVILYETRTTFRQIFLDSHTLIHDPQPTWMGYSTGKWERDTLVVTTVGFNDKTWLDDDGHPHSTSMRVTERFRRPNFGHLLVDITIDDPKAYSHPWTVTEEFLLDPDDELLEYACGENNLDPPHLVGK